MSALPSEAALREARFHIERDGESSLKNTELLDIIDCALLVRRLERWLHDDVHGPQRVVEFVSGPSIETTLRVHSRTSFVSHGPDILAALNAALEKAEKAEEAEEAK